MSSQISTTAAKLKHQYGALLTAEPRGRADVDLAAIRDALDRARDRLQGGSQPAAQLRLDLTAR